MLASLAGASPAQDFSVLEACAASRIGAPDCAAEDLAEALGLLSVSDVKAFSAVGMEGFALLTAMRHVATALFFASEGEGCVAEEERTTAVEIWSIWVRLPRDAPKAIAAKFDIYSALMDEIIDLEVAC